MRSLIRYDLRCEEGGVGGEESNVAFSG